MQGSSDVAIPAARSDSVRTIDTLPRLDSPSQRSSSPQRVSAGSQQDNHSDELVPDVPDGETKHRLGSGDCWRSIWLYWQTLAAFGALFAALVVALVVLLMVIRSRNGLYVNLSSTNHLAWTYGPNAVFVLVATLWRQVSFYCKLMQPWQQLTGNGFMPPDQTVLLDYIEPLDVVSIPKALRRKHFPVALSAGGYILLKIVMLFSAGLLVLTPTTLEEVTSITLTSDLVYSKTLQQLTGPLQVGINTFVDVEPSYTSINSSAVYQYAGIANGDYDQSPGVDDTYVYQTMMLDPAKQILHADVDVAMLQSNITCELANVTLENPQLGQLTQYGETGVPTLQIESPTCRADRSSRSTFQIASPRCQPGRCPEYSIEYDFGRVDCSGTCAHGAPTFSIASNTTCDLRYALWVSRYTYVRNQEPESNSTVYGLHEQTSAIICKASYSVGNGSLHYDSANNKTTADHYNSTGHLGNFTDLMLGERLLASMISASTAGLDESQFSESLSKPTPDIAIYPLLLQSLQGNKKLSRLLDTELFRSGASRIWNAVALKTMELDAVQPFSKDTDAMVVYAQDRLQVSDVALWLMIAGLLLAIVISISLIYSLSHGLISANPALISTSVAILKVSPGMQHLLRTAGHLNEHELATHVQDHRFLAIEGRQLLSAKYNGPSSRKKTKKTKNDKTNRAVWIPLAATWYMVLLTIAFPLAIIVALEVLYRISSVNSGIADVTTKEKVATLASRVLTALVMTLVVMLFDALDSTVSRFAPYHLLATRAMPVSRCLNFQVSGQLPPVALWKSLSRRHYGSALSNAATLIGSILTVIASGLWLVDQHVIVEQDAQAMTIDFFNISWYNSSVSGDGGAAVYLDKLRRREVDMPVNIWNDFVMPNVANFSIPGQNYSLQLPALKARLDCDVVSSDRITVMQSKYDASSWLDGGENITTIIARPILDPTCQHAGANGTEDHYTYSAVGVTRNSPGDSEWMGTFADLHLGPWPSGVDDNQQATDTWGEDGDGLRDIEFNEFPDNPAGCPSIGIIFSHYYTESSLDQIRENTTVLLCSQRIEQAKLIVHYANKNNSAPSIDETIAPSLIANTSLFLTNGTPGIDSFPYRVEAHLNSGLTNLALNGFSSRIITAAIPSLTQASMSQLLGTAGQQALIDVVQSFYAKYMSLIIDMKFRQPIASQVSDQRMPVQGSVKTASSRLQMNFTSKIVLQIVLAVVIGLGIGALCLSGLRSTLPRQPTSIASVFALLAGSSLCDEQDPKLLQPGEPASGRVVSKTSDNKALYSLGWWHDLENRQSNDEGQVEDGNPTRRFGIDQGEADRLGYRDSRWTLRRRVKRSTAVASVGSNLSSGIALSDRSASIAQPHEHEHAAVTPPRSRPVSARSSASRPMSAMSAEASDVDELPPDNVFVPTTAHVRGSRSSHSQVEGELGDDTQPRSA